MPLKVEPDPPLDDSNNPWLGLEAYTAASKDLFFGRTAETAELVARVTERRPGDSLVALVGASGAGKSSLVQAGLVPGLNPSKWAIAQSARLAGDPNQAVAAAIKELGAAPKDRRRLLIIDQFEELFTQCPDDAQRAQFLKSFRELVDAKDGLLVVITLRSDFELRASEDESLSDIWQAARYQVPSFSSDELRRVIMAPARVKAVYYDPTKVADDLFDEVVQTPGALPLLSFALAELYRQAQVRRRQSGAADRALATADYDAIGGVVGALNRRATQLYDDAAPDEQQAIRRVFLRLVSQEGAGLARRQVERAELQFGDGDDAEQQCVDRVIQRYVDAGLLVIDGDSVEPAHDALVAQWQQLHDWLKASDSQDLIRAAWRAVCEWEAHAKVAGYLWNADPRLPQLAAAHRAGELNASEREFETASTRRRTARRRRLATTVATVIVVLATVAAIALVERNQADSSAVTARTNAAGADSLLFAAPAASLVQSHLDDALLLALQANQFSSTEPARSAMTLALERALTSGLVGIIGTGSTYRVEAVAFSPDGKTLVSGGSAVLVWDLASHASGPRLQSNVESPSGNSLAVNPVQSLAFSPAGKEVASLWSDGALRLWKLVGGKPQETDLVEPFSVNGDATVLDAAFSADGETLASGDANGNVTLWDLGAGKPTGKRLRGAGDVASVAFSRHGKTLALVGANGKVRLQYLASPSSVAKPLQGSRDVSTVAFSPDRRTLATGGRHGEVMLWDLASPRPHGILLPGTGHAPVLSLAFSNDGKALASSDGNDHVRLWNVAGRNPHVIPALGAFGSGVAFSPDGKTLATGGGDGKVRLWNVAAGAPPGMPATVGSASIVALSPDGQTLVSGDKAGKVTLWSLTSLGPVGPPFRGGGNASVTSAAVSPDGTLLAAGDSDGKVRLWNLTSGKLLRTLSTGAGNVSLTNLDFSPDGSELATGRSDAKMQLWNAATGTLLATLVYGGDEPMVFPSSVAFPGGSPASSSFAFSPEGSELAFIGQSFCGNGGLPTGTVWLWNLESRQQREVQIGCQATASGDCVCPSVSTLAFSPDGTTLAIGVGGTVRLGDPASPGLAGPPLASSHGSVSSVAFSPDGQTLAVGYDNGAIQLWDPASRQPLGVPLAGDGSSVSRLAFSRDGRTLMSVGADGRVQVWKGLVWTDFQDLQNQVCRLVWRNLTPAEWASFAPPVPYLTVCPG